MKAILLSMLPTIMDALLKMLPEDVIQDGLDALFDKIEERVQASDTPVDDALVLPILKRLRSALNVPDEDG